MMCIGHRQQLLTGWTGPTLHPDHTAAIQAAPLDQPARVRCIVVLLCFKLVPVAAEDAAAVCHSHKQQQDEAAHCAKQDLRVKYGRMSQCKACADAFVVKATVEDVSYLLESLHEHAAAACSCAQFACTALQAGLEQTITHSLASTLDAALTLFVVSLTPVPRPCSSAVAPCCRESTATTPYSDAKREEEAPPHQVGLTSAASSPACVHGDIEET